MFPVVMLKETCPKAEVAADLRMKAIFLSFFFFFFFLFFCVHFLSHVPRCILTEQPQIRWSFADNTEILLLHCCFTSTVNI